MGGRRLELLLAGILVLFFAGLAIWGEREPPRAVTRAHGAAAAPSPPRLHGHVLLPGAARGEGGFVLARGDSGTWTARLSASGAFDFGELAGALPRGAYELSCQLPEGRRWAGSERTRALTLEQDRHVLLDLGPVPAPRLRVRVETGRVRLPALEASLRGPVPAEAWTGLAQDFELPARRGVELQLVVDWALPGAHVQLREELQLESEEHELVLRLPFAPLRLELAPEAPLWLVRADAEGPQLLVELRSPAPDSLPLPTGSWALGRYRRAQQPEPAVFDALFRFTHAEPGTWLGREDAGTWSVRRWR